MYLIDTNIWLENLLGQDRSEEVKTFLSQMMGNDLWMTDFSLHSISIILTKQGLFSLLEVFIREVVIDGGVNLIGLSPTELGKVISSMQGYGLDFDDAYQYVVAESYHLSIVSFDKHFDVTPKGRAKLESIVGMWDSLD